MAGRKPKSQSDKIRDIHAPPKVETGRKDDGGAKNNLQAIREAEQAQLLSVMANLRTATAEVEKAQAVVKEKRDVVNSILDQAQAAGFKKGEVRELLKDTAVKGTRKDLREAEERRVRFREYLGLPVGTQPDLLERMPDGAMDELDWRGHGYTAGLRGDSCDPKAASVPDRFHQAWMEEWGRGQEKIAWSLNPSKKANPGDAPTADSVKEAPSPADGGDGFEATADELAAQSSRPSTIEATDPGVTADPAVDAQDPDYGDGTADPDEAV